MTVMTVTRDECLRELREHGVLPSSYEAIWLGGSLIRGWGNATSDFDVYVIVTEPWTHETTSHSATSVGPGPVPVEVFYVDGRRWDIEYWLDSQVDEILRRVSWESFEAGRYTGGDFTRHEIAMVQRLLTGVVVEGDDWARRRVAEFDSSAMRTMMTSVALYELDLLTEDAVGQLEVGDVNSAVLSAKFALGWAVEAVLASHGEFHEQEKWRARRLQMLQPPELSFDDYWQLETMRSYDPETPEKWVEEVLRTCQHVSTEVRL
jgi:hypothetical protein